MRLTYKTNKLQKSLTTDKGLVKTYGSLAKKIKLRMNQLEAADNLSVIAKIPVLRLHPYKGQEQGTWSIDIHQNWRILFEIDQKPVPTLEDGGLNLKAIKIIRITAVKDPH